MSGSRVFCCPAESPAEAAAFATSTYPGRWQPLEDGTVTVCDDQPDHWHHALVEVAQEPGPHSGEQTLQKTFDLLDRVVAGLPDSVDALLKHKRNVAE